jgi:hypothetical protein
MITQLKKPTIRPQFLFALSFAGLLLAFVVNYFIFRYIFERSYLEWYLSAGPMIALATAAFGAAWGSLDKNPHSYRQTLLPTLVHACRSQVFHFIRWEHI